MRQKITTSLFPYSSNRAAHWDNIGLECVEELLRGVVLADGVFKREVESDGQIFSQHIVDIRSHQLCQHYKNHNHLKNHSIPH